MEYRVLEKINASKKRGAQTRGSDAKGLADTRSNAKLARTVYSVDVVCHNVPRTCRDTRIAQIFDSL